MEPETGEEIKKSNNVIQKKKRKSGGQERKKGDERKGKLQVQVGMVTTKERFFVYSFIHVVRLVSPRPFRIVRTRPTVVDQLLSDKPPQFFLLLGGLLLDLRPVARSR